MSKLQKFKKKTNKVNIKNLLISFVIILLGLTILGVYKTFAIYKIDKEYDLIVSKIGDFRGKNQVISYYINNQESDVIPEDKNYEVYVNCENATGTWNESEWKLELSNITKYTVTCTVNFKEKYVIENAKSTNNSIIANYSNIENISSNYYLYGTDKNNLNQKSHDIANLNSDTTYYFKKCYEDNNEEICSDVSSLLTAGKVTDFDYTGGEQTYTTTCNGTYKLETWGAEGGAGIFDIATYRGGYGAYSKGSVQLNRGDVLYLNVGGKGIEKYYNLSDLVSVNSNGNGYNGGGAGTGRWNSGGVSGGGGGGATHIAIKSGLLSTLENYKSNILIVSGAGGGGMSYDVKYSGDWTGIGGSGGGINGDDAINTNSHFYCQAYGANQTSAGVSIYDETNASNYINTCPYYNGSFGQGGSYHNNKNEGGYSSGGGGGFYGGAGAVHGASSGGSGYIGNSLLTNKVMYCYNCEESTEESTKTISTTCTSETPTENCSKQGNGYARITIEECSI